MKPRDSRGAIVVYRLQSCVAVTHKVASLNANVSCLAGLASIAEMLTKGFGTRFSLRYSMFYFMSVHSKVILDRFR